MEDPAVLAARHDAEVAAQRQHDERQKGLLRALFECVARWLPACGVSVCLCVCVSVFLCVCVSVRINFVRQDLSLPTVSSPVSLGI